MVGVHYVWNHLKPCEWGCPLLNTTTSVIVTLSIIIVVRRFQYSVLCLKETLSAVWKKLLEFYKNKERSQSPSATHSYPVRLDKNDLHYIELEAGVEDQMHVNWQRFVQYLQSIGAVYLEAGPSDRQYIVTACDKGLLSHVTMAVKCTNGSEKAVVQKMCKNSKNVTEKVVKYALDQLVMESEIISDYDEHSRIVYRAV